MVYVVHSQKLYGTKCTTFEFSGESANNDKKKSTILRG